MKNLEKGKFKIESNIGVAISDVNGRYYNGDHEAEEASFHIVSEDDKECSIVEFKDINNTYDNFEVFQVASDTTEKEIIELVKSNKQWFDDVISWKIENPDENGEM
ncbi:MULTISPECIES: hypothetical protein [unclassified Empedobacter]|uniref:hypothetical protein n=1 Tax=unclassified Empedobacter TaxID=2643773 RepID=UPI0025C56A2A|nr:MULTISPECIES: hypothetical protein [unclassified Empedobacter]